MLESSERAGSLRRAARECGVDVLVYEGGEGLRFDEFAISAGVDGIARVMLRTGMLELPDGVEPPPTDEMRRPVFANASKWVRAPDGGVFRSLKRIGNAVSENEPVGVVANPYEGSELQIRSPRRGIIIGATTLPVVNMGDALFHIAWAEEHDRSKAALRRVQRSMEPPPEVDDTEPEAVMDEDEII
jgi:predicted deacylase